MNRRPHKLGAIAMGGLTPLLDTLFLLLFALLAISDVRRERQPLEEVLVELPAVVPDPAGAESEGQRIELLVDADSRLRVGTANVPVATPRELDDALDALAAGRAARAIAIEIRADRESRHGVAVELLQHLRARGHRDVVLVALGASDPDRAFGAEPEDER